MTAEVEAEDTAMDGSLLLGVTDEELTTDFCDNEVGDSTAVGDDSTSTNKVVDKEMLRKIKRKEKMKLNKKKKKAFARSIAHMTGHELQQSVASITPIGGMGASTIMNTKQMTNIYPGQVAEEVGVVSALPVTRNDNSSNPTTNSIPNTFVNANSTFMDAPVVVAGTEKPIFEVALCVIDQSDWNLKLNNIDLTAINEYLELCLYKDLTVTQKIKIDTTYLSMSKRVWIICNSSFTCFWVIKRIAEMPMVNGRKYTAHTMNELDIMSSVSILVPKECHSVQTLPDLIRLLCIQNPGLGRGRAVFQITQNQATVAGVDVGENKAENETKENGDVSEQKPESASEENGGDAMATDPTEAEAEAAPIEHGDDTAEAHTEGAASDTACNAKDSSTTNTSVEFEIKPEVLEPALFHSKNEVEKPFIKSIKPRSFNFFVDDVFLMELRRLGFRPYLGLRRLLCVMGERLIQNAPQGSVFGRMHGLPSIKKKRRTGNKRKLV